jgi:transcriptional regulator with XRE-family HTH domain
VGDDDLGKNLRAARRRRGLTQEEVSELSGVIQSDISLIERGERDPRAATIRKLAAAVDVSPGELFDGLAPKPH